MLVGGKGLTCVGGKLFFFFRVMLREIVGSIFLSQWVFLSLTEGISISHRAHRVHGGFWRTFRAHRRPPAYRKHRAFQLMKAVRLCDIG